MLIEDEVLSRSKDVIENLILKNKEYNVLYARHDPTSKEDVLILKERGKNKFYFVSISKADKNYPYKFSGLVYKTFSYLEEDLGLELGLNNIKSDMLISYLNHLSLISSFYLLEEQKLDKEIIKMIFGSENFEVITYKNFIACIVANNIV